MSKIGESIIRALEQALAHAQGTADASQFKVHVIERRIPISPKKGKLMPPLHPGEMLREEFLIPLRMTARMLAKEIKMPERRVVAIVKGRQGLDADLCLRLARFFRMSPEFWMNIQKDYELETARLDWPKICKEVRLHPQDRKTGALKVPKNTA
ncbi:MAG: HigA family addiction module antitoxin [Terracidiphilus sp.]|jgi:addiction module HigA family antidote